MKLSFRRRRLAAAALALIGMPATGAQAFQSLAAIDPSLAVAAPAGAGTATLTVSAPAPVAVRTAFGGAVTVSDRTLGRIAGREDLSQTAQSDHTATVTQNSVGDDSVTGSVAIKDSAFQNMTGLSVININTGNNVAVNAAINVNLSMAPNP